MKQNEPTLVHNRCWKQPIPTNLNQIFGDNYLAKHIYIELLLRARTSDEEKEFAKSLHFLKRGQCVCGQEELAEEFRVNRKTIESTLKKLQKLYNKVDIRTTPKGTVITIKDFDNVIRMDNKTDSKVTTGGQQRDTNKNDKSEKKHGWTSEALKAIESLGGINI